MKMKGRRGFLRPEEKTIAAFGPARLGRTLDGKTELRAGTAQDRPKAREWIALFRAESKGQARCMS
jgi:hypothetical protein